MFLNLSDLSALSALSDLSVLSALSVRSQSNTMAGLNAQAYAQLTTLLEENGLTSILGGLSNWTSANPGQCITGEQRVPKKTTSAKSKKGLLNLLNEKYPDWELGKGKGFSVSALKNALETGEKPEPTKRENPYFDFLAIVRKEVADLGLPPKQVVSLGGIRWTVLKQFAAENGHTNKEVVKNPELLKKVAANYASIEEDLKDVEIAKKEKKAKKAKKVEKVEKVEVEKVEKAKKAKKPKKAKKVEKTKKDETPEDDVNDQPVAGLFCMSDEDSDDEDSDDEDSDDEDSDDEDENEE